MKRILIVLVSLFLLTGCTSFSSELDRAMALRESVLAGNGCSFVAVVTADYGDVIYSFQMHCQSDPSGNMTFEVKQPETISGIKGTVSGEGGKLVFDDQALLFEMLADGQITPVSAPWLFINSLRGGYINGCGRDGQGMRIQIDDSYEQDALQLDIWTDKEDLPIHGEIIWKGKRIVSLDVENFVIL